MARTNIHPYVKIIIAAFFLLLFSAILMHPFNVGRSESMRLSGGVLLNDIYLNTIEYRLMEIEHILSLQKEKKSEYQRRMSLILKQIGRKQLQYESLPVSREEIEAYEKFVSNWGNYINQSKENIVVSNENQLAAAESIRDSRLLFDTSNQTLRVLIALNTKYADSLSGFLKGWIKEHGITLIFLSICGMTACFIFIFNRYDKSEKYKDMQ